MKNLEKKAAMLAALIVWIAVLVIVSLTFCLAYALTDKNPSTQYSYSDDQDQDYYVDGAMFTQGLRYTLSDDETYYKVYGIGDATDTYIVIPDTYEGKPVTSLGNSAFKACVDIKSVTIPQSITHVGYEVFFFCHSLTEIIYQGTVEQWSQIDGVKYMFGDPAAVTVYCTDGTFSPT